MSSVTNEHAHGAEHRTDRSGTLVRTAALATIVMGLVVIVGWYVHVPALVQIRPTFAPMQYNTALGFVLSGAALWCASSKRRRAARVLAGGAGTLGGLSLLQYVLNVNFGIDQLFVEPFVAVATTHVGRMAPNTATCFTLGALALLASDWRGSGNAYVVSACCALTVISLGVVAILGYAAGIDPGYGWGVLTRMAIHTSLGFTLIGSGLSAHLWCRRPTDVNERARWLGEAAAISVFLVVVVLWQALERQRKLELQRTVEAGAATWESEVLQTLEREARILQRFAGRWGQPRRADWRADAASVLAGMTGAEGVAWIGADLEVFASEPPGWAPRRLPSEPLQSLLERVAGAPAAGGFSVLYTSDPSHNLDVLGFAVPTAPVGDAPSFLLSCVDVDELFGAIRERAEAMGYELTLSRPERGGSTRAKIARAMGLPACEIPVGISGVEWTLSAVMTEELVQRQHSPYLAIVVLPGALLVFLLWTTFRQARLAETHWASIQQANTELAAEVAVRQRAEQELRDLNFSLEGRVRERTATLQESQAAAVEAEQAARREQARAKAAEQRARGYAGKLERSSNELAEFAYVASHDLQEPLRMVADYTKQLSQRYSGQLDAESEKLIELSFEGAARMQCLIDDLLTYSGVGSRSAEFEPTSTQAVLDQCRRDLALLIQESGAVVHSEPLPDVLGDAPQLRQLFLHLVGNSIKFHGDAQPEVHISVVPIGEFWEFEVRDNGVGFESAEAERIFRSFQRLRDREGQPGRGVGLAICRKVVEGHGGTIRAQSTPGEGASFHFTLKRATSGGESAQNAEAGSSAEHPAA